MIISRWAFGLYTLLSLVLLLNCKPNGPFLSYFTSFGASSIGLVVHSGDIKRKCK